MLGGGKELSNIKGIRVKKSENEKKGAAESSERGLDK